MSSEIQKGKVIQHGYGGRTESHLEITVAVKNPETGQWEKPKLDVQEVHAVKEAIETIRQMGANAASWKAVNQKGAVLEMTESGIFVQEGGEWKDLLADPQADGEPVRTALKAITTIAGEKLEQTGAVPKDVAQHADDLQQGDVVIEVRVIPTVIANLKGHHESRKELTKRLSAFVKEYEDNRELFESLMRKNGVSDLKSASIFNHYVMLYKELKKWDTAFQGVVDLANQGNYSESLKAYALLIETALPQLLKQVRNARLVIHHLGEPGVQKAFQAFALKANLSHDHQIFADLRGVERIGTTLQAAFKESMEDAYEAGIGVPEEAMRAFNKMGELIRSEEVALSQYSRLYTQNHRLLHFFSGLLTQTRHSLHQPWKNVLKKYGWSLEKIQDFTKLNNQYAGYIQSLEQAQQAIALEVDPTKRRALQAQFKQWVRALMPQIDKIHRELHKLGGMKQYRTLIAAAQELARFASSKNLKAVEDLQTEALSLVRLMEERVDYISALCEKLDMVVPAGGLIARNLLQGPHSRDPAFLQMLADNGWKPDSIRWLSTWYDAFMKEVLPIQLAKKNLDADPENITLQRALKKVVEGQIPKLNALKKEFTNTIGDKESLGNLEWAMGLYGNRVMKDLANLESTVGLGTLKHTQMNDLRKQIGEAKTTLSMLSSLHILTDFNATEAFIGEMVRFVAEPMSWDKDFLSELVPTHNQRSPLKNYGVSKGISAWERCLDKNKVEPLEVLSIKMLLNNYQKHLEPLMILERKLEAHPEDARLRGALLRQLAFHNNALLTLESKYEELSAKINSLDQALQDFKSGLENDIVQMKAASAGTTGDIAEAAKATELAARNTLLIVNRLDVLNAFRQKREFVADVMRRFTRRTVA